MSRSSNTIALLRFYGARPRRIPELRRWVTERRASTLGARRPWWPYEVAPRVASRLPKQARVLEFGGGGSTLWLADRGAHVDVVEHEPAWAEELQAAAGATVNVRMVPAGTTGSVGSARDTRFFDDYVATAHDYPDDSFDLVIIDGRARVECGLAAMTKVKPGGMLLLDDSDRARYEPLVDALSEWDRVDFSGVKLGGGGPICKTTLWERSREASDISHHHSSNDSLGKKNRKVVVHLDWGRNPETWRSRQEAGEVGPGDPYGYGAIADYYNLAYSRDHLEGRLVRFFRQTLKKALGYDFVHAWRNREVLSSGDFVVTHTEHEFLAVLILDLIRRDNRRRVLCNSIWLWDRWTRMSPVRKWPLLVLLRRALAHTVHSRENLTVALSADTRRPTVRVPFGIHPLGKLPFQDRTERGSAIRILAPGNDRHRDWECLRRAIEKLPDTDVRVRSGRHSAATLRSVGASVRRSSNVNEYQQELQWADVVVVPLTPNLHNSGITVALEALGAGRRVVIADCGGLRDYLGDAAFYYVPGDAQSLAQAIRNSQAEQQSDAVAARPFSLQSRGLTAQDHALRHVILLDHLETSRIPDEVSAFQPVRPRTGGT